MSLVYVSNLTLLAPCMSSQDCAKEKEKTVCKESDKTGEKSCREPSKKTCSGACKTGEYCSGKNICVNGLIGPCVIHVYHCFFA